MATALEIARREIARRDIAIRASNEPAGVLAARHGLTTSQVSRIRKSPGRQLTNRERFQLEVVEGGWKAACMEPDDWRDWVAMNPMSVAMDKSIAVRPCRDCPTEFAAEMSALGRCNGVPGTNEAKESAMATGGAAHRFTKLPAARDERIRLVIDTVRSSKNHHEAGAKLGVSNQRVAQVIGEARVAGLLPPDVAALLRSRSRYRNRLDPALAESQRTPPSEVPAVQALDEHGLSTDAAIEPEGVKPTGDEHEALKHSAQVDVVLPCHGCAHAVVCSIKPMIETFHEDVAGLAELHTGVRIAAVAIACDHFLEAAS